VLKFYGDDSGEPTDPNDGVVAVGGFIGSAAQWRVFEAEWKRMLVEHGVPYVHMREFDQFVGPFERFEKDKKATIALLSAMASAIIDCQLIGYGAVVLLAELERFHAKYPEEGKFDPHSLCLYVACGHVTDRVQIREPWQVIMDRVPDVHRKLADADSLLDTDIHLREVLAKNGYLRPSFTSISRDGPGAREIPALQAADFYAWEMHRSLHLKLPWLLNVKPLVRPQTPMAFNLSLLAYQARAKKIRKVKIKDRWPVVERRSYARLMETRTTDYSIVDLDQLEIMRAYRNGLPLPAKSDAQR
jgi:hypothetical protein